MLGPLALLPKCFSQLSASLRYGAREWQDWYCFNEGCKLCRRFRFLAPQHSLINFHIGDNANGDALLCELLNELQRFGFLGKEIDNPIRINEVGHELRIGVSGVVLCARCAYVV